MTLVSPFHLRPRVQLQVFEVIVERGLVHLHILSNLKPPETFCFFFPLNFTVLLLCVKLPLPNFFMIALDLEQGR